MKQNTPDGREAYITPSIEVIKMENEGVIATSGEPYHPITRSYSGSTSTHSYNSASSSDLEDLINDILTVVNLGGLHYDEIKKPYASCLHGNCCLDRIQLQPRGI